MLSKLREQHRQRRAPYVHELIGQHEGLRTRSMPPGRSTRVG
jgi:hypothetical protein